MLFLIVSRLASRPAPFYSSELGLFALLIMCAPLIWGGCSPSVQPKEIHSREIKSRFMKPEISVLSPPSSDWFLLPQAPFDNGRRANYSYFRVVWRVSNVGGKIRVHSERSDNWKEDTVPFATPFRRSDSGGQMTWQAKTGDWAVGYKGGTYTGGVWTVTEDGRDSYLQTYYDAEAFIRFNDGLLVLGNWMDRDERGRGLGLYAGPDMRATDDMETIAIFDSAPRAWATDGADVYVVTASTLWRLSPGRPLIAMCSVYTDGLRVNSMALESKRVVWLGMNYFVVRLDIGTGQCGQEWFAPAACSAFKLGYTSCICTRGELEGRPCEAFERSLLDRGL